MNSQDEANCTVLNLPKQEVVMPTLIGFLHCLESCLLVLKHTVVESAEFEICCPPSVCSCADERFQLLQLVRGAGHQILAELKHSHVAPAIPRGQELVPATGRHTSLETRAAVRYLTKTVGLVRSEIFCTKIVQSTSKGQDGHRELLLIVIHTMAH